jgi:GT2 family glycosyltransferase
MKNSISVVIPNYNGKHLLEENLPSVFEAITQSYISKYEIIVSDDVSTDNSVSYLKNEFPEVIVIENEENAGFAGNINRGIQRASMELTLILNSDCQLTPNFFEPLLPYFHEESTFGVMGNIDDLTQKFYRYTPLGLKPFKHLTIPVRDSGYRMIVISGANSLLDTKKLQQLGGFDENFSPFYGEDDELGIRANRMGWNYFYEGKARCFHGDSSTIKKYYQQRRIRVIAKRNKLYLNLLHLSGFDRVIYMTVQALKLLSFWLIFKFEFYRSFFRFLKLLPKLFERRRQFSFVKSFKVAAREVLNQQVEKHG